MCIRDRHIVDRAKSYDSDTIPGDFGELSTPLSLIHILGRVQTPTLALIVEREQKIRKFKARPYWELEGHFACAAGTYTGKWFDESFAKNKTGQKAEQDEHQRAERLWDETRAKALQSKCAGHPGEVSEETKPSTQLSPLLFDLTSLQREANSRFGFSAKATLGLAQALYEKHKVLTLSLIHISRRETRSWLWKSPLGGPSFPSFQSARRLRQPTFRDVTG